MSVQDQRNITRETTCAIRDSFFFASIMRERIHAETWCRLSGNLLTGSPVWISTNLSSQKSGGRTKSGDKTIWRENSVSAGDLHEEIYNLHDGNHDYIRSLICGWRFATGGIEEGARWGPWCSERFFWNYWRQHRIFCWDTDTERDRNKETIFVYQRCYIKRILIRYNSSFWLTQDLYTRSDARYAPHSRMRVSSLTGSAVVRLG